MLSPVPLTGLLAQLPAPLTPMFPRQATEPIPGVAELLERRLHELVPAAIVAVLLLVVFWGLARAIGRLLDRAFDRAHVDPAVRGLTTRLSRFFILLFGVLLAARQMGLEVGSLVAGFGIVGLAVGLAAQDLLANLIAGFTILWDRPFRVGDDVTIGATSGTVLDIGLRTTRLRMADHRRLVLPNREVIAGAVIHHTASSRRHLHLKIGISHQQALAPVREALLAIASEHADVLDEPPPEVLVVAFTDAAVEIELRVQLGDVHPEGGVRFQLLEAIKERFERDGVAFASPQRTVRWVPASEATIEGGIKSLPNPPLPALDPP